MNVGEDESGFKGNEQVHTDLNEGGVDYSSEKLKIKVGFKELRGVTGSKGTA